jgi:hypothetical protein
VCFPAELQVWGAQVEEQQQQLLLEKARTAATLIDQARLVKLTFQLSQ